MFSAYGKRTSYIKDIDNLALEQPITPGVSDKFDTAETLKLRLKLDVTSDWQRVTNSYWDQVWDELMMVEHWLLMIEAGILMFIRHTFYPEDNQLHWWWSDELQWLCDTKPVFRPELRWRGDFGPTLNCIPVWWTRKFKYPSISAISSIRE